MDWKRQSKALLWIASAVLGTISLTGCGKPLLYHFKHYQTPFTALARSNQTYFHSGNTGKIIEKDPCMGYSEPGCYGYEPTTWTQWSPNCPGHFPVQGEQTSGQPVAPYDGQIITDSEVIMDPQGVILNDSASGDPISAESIESLAPADVEPTPPTSVKPNSTPELPSETRLPAIRVPSVPADIESVPSPSDSTQRLPKLDVEMPNPVQQRLVERKQLPLPEVVVAPPVAGPSTVLPPANEVSQSFDSAPLPIKIQPRKEAFVAPMVMKSPTSDAARARQPLSHRATKPLAQRIQPRPVVVPELPAPTAVERVKAAKPSISKVVPARKVPVPTTVESVTIAKPKVAPIVAKPIAVTDRPALQLPVAKKVQMARPAKKVETATSLSDKLRLRAEAPKPPKVEASRIDIKLGSNPSMLAIVDEFESKTSTAKPLNVRKEFPRPPAIGTVETSSSQLGSSQIEFTDLATKLKNVQSATQSSRPTQPSQSALERLQTQSKPTPMVEIKAKSTVKATKVVVKPQRPTTTTAPAVVLKTPAPKVTLKPASQQLNLSSGPSTVIRFAETTGNVSIKRISAQQDSELKIVK